MSAPTKYPLELMRRGGADGPGDARETGVPGGGVFPSVVYRDASRDSTGSNRAVRRGGRGVWGSLAHCADHADHRRRAVVTDIATDAGAVH
jgi:hypothetical protein